MGKIYKITDNLYIGSYRAAKKLKKLRKEGITAIVNLMEKEKYNPPPEFNYLFKSIKDRMYINHEVLKEILSFIEKNVIEGKVLVHCASGISRSGGIAVARLLMENPDWTWEDARKFVRKITTISPHPNIRQSILDFLEKKEGKRRSDIY
ncbi:MAG: dual specificity protein phosphatase family protein [Promethearchaeota archaeon]